MSTDLKRFGQIVLERRTQLGLSQLDVWRSGGPSNSTLTKVEGGQSPAPSASTLRKLDAGLRWVPGSALRALNGGDATPSAAETVDPTPKVLREIAPGKPEETARWMYERNRDLHRSSGSMDGARSMAMDMLKIDSALGVWLEAIETAMDLDAPRADIDHAITGALGLYMGSGALGTLSAVQPDLTQSRIDRLGEIRAINDRRAATPSFYDVLLDGIRRREEPTTDNGEEVGNRDRSAATKDADETSARSNVTPLHPQMSDHDDSVDEDEGVPIAALEDDGSIQAELEAQEDQP